MQRCEFSRLTAATLLAWLRLLALDGRLAKAELERCATAPCTVPPRPSRGGRQRRLEVYAIWP
jgi:hypothetical protein